jgi:hypothetical protein
MPETQRKNANACAVCEREREEKDIRLKPVKSNSFSFVAGSERPWYRHASVAFLKIPTQHRMAINKTFTTPK